MILNEDKERRDEDWVNPPEDREEYCADWDSIADEIWLLKQDEKQGEKK